MTKEIDKVALIKIRNGKILCAKSKGKTKFYIPGGKRERGESDQETLEREIKEELSVDVVPDSVSFLGVFKAVADGATDGTIVKMTCYKAELAGELKVNNEIEEMRWLDCSNMDIVSNVDKIIFNYLNQKGELD